ncbi:hypothetical protein F5877DRAFT_67961 [Lentinula edodes]|nr:hypothetical protein F5877DRAFT_67961 [Lentinula edodes]
MYRNQIQYPKCIEGASYDAVEVLSIWFGDKTNKRSTELSKFRGGSQSHRFPFSVCFRSYFSLILQRYNLKVLKNSYSPRCTLFKYALSPLPPTESVTYIFGSIIGLCKAYSKLTKAHKYDFHVDLTLLDIHPTALPRDLSIIGLLDAPPTRTQPAFEDEKILETIFFLPCAVCSCISAGPDINSGFASKIRAQLDIERAEINELFDRLPNAVPALQPKPIRPGSERGGSKKAKKIRVHFRVEMTDEAGRTKDTPEILYEVYWCQIGVMSRYPISHGDYIYTWPYEHFALRSFLISSTVPYSAAASNYLLNISCTPSRYTLPSTADVPLPPGFLGCQVKHVALVSGLISLAQPLEGYYPVPLSKQASRAELVHLLTPYTVHIGSTDVQGYSAQHPHLGAPPAAASLPALIYLDLQILIRSRSRIEIVPLYLDIPSGFLFYAVRLLPPSVVACPIAISQLQASSSQRFSRTSIVHNSHVPFTSHHAQSSNCHLHSRTPIVHNERQFFFSTLWYSSLIPSSRLSTFYPSFSELNSTMDMVSNERDGDTVVSLTSILQNLHLQLDRALNQNSQRQDTLQEPEVVAAAEVPGNRVADITVDLLPLVTAGLGVGIFPSLQLAQPFVHKVKGNFMRGFTTREQAEADFCLARDLGLLQIIQ